MSLSIETADEGAPAPTDEPAQEGVPKPTEPKMEGVPEQTEPKMEGVPASMPLSIARRSSRTDESSSSLRLLRRGFVRFVRLLEPIYPAWAVGNWIRQIVGTYLTCLGSR